MLDGTMLEILLAVLSGSAAAGLRVALPLLVIVVYGGELWQRVPLLSGIPTAVIVGILVSWSVLEFFASKDRFGQRLLQIFELISSPIVGALIGIAIATGHRELAFLQVVVFATIGAVLALVLQLLQMGVMYRLRRIPLWALFAQDAACVGLTLFAFGSPIQGGLIALILLWLAIRSATQWRRLYREGRALQRVRSSDY
jgi:hypothetical protein